jgi:peptide/nickel transport system permease protein
MGRYLIRRLLQSIPLLMLITVLVFVLLKTAGDPLAYLANDPKVSAEDKARLRRSLGLEDPLPLQFVHWLIGDDWYKRDLDLNGEPETFGKRLGILRGDFGNSIRYNRPVTEVIGGFLPNTLLLGGTAFLVTIILGLLIGIYAALRQYTWIDNVITTISFITFSFPIFLIALLSVLVFAVLFKQWGLPYLPVQGMYEVRGDKTLVEVARHMILPVMSIAAISVAGYSRFIRASMLEVINSDYVRTAKAKGLSQRRIVYLHAFKNASLPLITLIGLNIPFILSGAVVTETIFAWPGMGRLFIDSLNFLDSPVLIISVMMTAIAVVICQLLTDVAYAWVDPRIRYS